MNRIFAAWAWLPPKTKTPIFIFAALFSMSACSHKSVFEVKSSHPQARLMQYCGGQQWGYVRRLSSDRQGPYLAVYFENQFLKEGDSVIANIVIHSLSEVRFRLSGTDIQIIRDGTRVPDPQPNFWILRTEKTISDRYPDSKYRVKRLQGAENEFEVRKLKYGGFFGAMAHEEPFIVKIEKYQNEEVKAQSVEIPLDPEKMDGIFLIKKTVALFDEGRPQTAKIEVKIPKFEVNGISVPEATFVLNYDRERLVAATKNAPRCASLNEIIRWARLDDSSWSFLSGPKISE